MTRVCLSSVSPAMPSAGHSSPGFRTPHTTLTHVRPSLEVLSGCTTRVAMSQRTHLRVLSQGEAPTQLKHTFLQTAAETFLPTE